MAAQFWRRRRGKILTILRYFSPWTLCRIYVKCFKKKSVLEKKGTKETGFLAEVFRGKSDYHFQLLPVVLERRVNSSSTKSWSSVDFPWGIICSRVRLMRVWLKYLWRPDSAAGLLWNWELIIHTQTYFQQIKKFVCTELFWAFSESFLFLSNRKFTFEILLFEISHRG